MVRACKWCPGQCRWPAPPSTSCALGATRGSPGACRCRCVLGWSEGGCETGSVVLECRLFPAGESESFVRHCGAKLAVWCSGWLGAFLLCALQDEQTLLCRRLPKVGAPQQQQADRHPPYQNVRTTRLSMELCTNCQAHQSSSAHPACMLYCAAASVLRALHAPAWNGAAVNACVACPPPHDTRDCTAHQRCCCTFTTLAATGHAIAPPPRRIGGASTRS